MSAVSGKGTRLNKRGLETRRTLLDTAIRCLAEGGAESVSANRVAREAGVTWGTVQHQFGDVDGLWAAVLADAPQADRVVEAVELLWEALDSPHARAVFRLRTALPHDPDTLKAEFPLTAAAIEGQDPADRDEARRRLVEALADYLDPATEARSART